VSCTITKLEDQNPYRKKWAADDPIEALPGERTPNGTGLAGQHWESSSPVERLHGLSSFKPQCGIPTVKGVLCNWQLLANQHDGADEADSSILVPNDYRRRPLSSFRETSRESPASCQPCSCTLQRTFIQACHRRSTGPVLDVLYELELSKKVSCINPTSLAVSVG
jgi:hypothetical protein